MSSSFFENYKKPEWQKRRLEILERAGWACEWCGDGEMQLQVHHKKYFKGRMPWEYRDDQLIALCEACHEESHMHMDRINSQLSAWNVDGPMNLMILASLLEGIRGARHDGISPHEEMGYRLGADLDRQFSQMCKKARS